MAEAAINKLEELVPETREVKKTAYEVYRDRFRAEGLEAGLRRGKAEGLEAGLRRGKAEGLEAGLRRGKAEGLEAGLRRGNAEGREEGTIAGLRAALHAVVAERGFTPTAAEAQRIVQCEDIAQLTRWVAQAATAASVEQALG